MAAAAAAAAAVAAAAVAAVPAAGPGSAALAAAGAAAAGAVEVPVSQAELLARELGIPQGKAAWILTNQPVLGSFPAAALRRRLESLASDFPWTTAELSVMIMRHPLLLQTQPQRLQEQLGVLGRALGLEQPHAARVAAKQPALLGAELADMEARLRQLASALNVSSDRARAIAAGQPVTLLMHEQQLQQRLRAMAEALEVSKHQAAALVCACPRLIAASPATLGAKLQVLRQCLLGTPEEVTQAVLHMPGVLEYSAASLESRVSGLKKLLGGAKALRTLLAEEPSLLTRSPSDVSAKLEALGTMLGLEQPQVLRLVLRRPSLLTTSTHAVRGSWSALSVWRFSPGFKAELIAEHPLLLRLSAREVHGRCRWLRGLMLRSAHMHATLRRVPPTLLGAILLHLPAAWERLEYIAEAGHEGSMPLMDAVQASSARFRAQFPEFDKWRSFSCGSQQGQVGV